MGGVRRVKLQFPISRTLNVSTNERIIYHVSDCGIVRVYSAYSLKKELLKSELALFQGAERQCVKFILQNSKNTDRKTERRKFRIRRLIHY